MVVLSRELQGNGLQDRMRDRMCVSYAAAQQDDNRTATVAST